MCVRIILYIYIYIYNYIINTPCVRMFSTTFPRIHPGPAFQCLLPLFVTEEPGISLGKNLFPQIWSKNLALKWFGPPCCSPTFKFIVFFLNKTNIDPKIIGGLDWKLLFLRVYMYVYIYIHKYMYANYHLPEKAEKSIQTSFKRRAGVTSPMRCAGTSTRGSSGS